MKIELIQLAGRDGDVAYNLDKVCEAIANATDATDLIVFPETYISGFPTKNNIEQLAETLDGPSISKVHALAREKNVAVVIGMAEKCEGKFHNTTVLITPEDGVLGYYRKTHLWASDKGIFTAGDRYTCVEWKGVKIGFLICFDIEFPESARALAELGTELIIVTNGNMDPYANTHKTAIKARAQENQTFAVMVNRVGLGDDYLVFAGGSCVVNPAGEVISEAGREPCRLLVNINPKQCEEYRQAYDYLAERRLSLSGEKVVQENGQLDWLIS